MCDPYNEQHNYTALERTAADIYTFTYHILALDSAVVKQNSLPRMYGATIESK